MQLLEFYVWSTVGVLNKESCICELYIWSNYISNKFTFSHEANIDMVSNLTLILYQFSSYVRETYPLSVIKASVLLWFQFIARILWKSFIQAVPWGGNVPDFGRMFLTVKYADITQNTCIRSWTVTEIMARKVLKYDSCYTLIDYQIHIKTARNM